MTLGNESYTPLLAAFAAAIILFWLYCHYKTDPLRKEREDAERAFRADRANDAIAEAERDRLFYLEMAKLGYSQVVVLESETIEEDSDEYGPKKDIRREWQLAWVRDGAKPPTTETS